MALAFDNCAAPAAAPPLKWAGGKRWLVQHLWPYWSGNENRRLVEPFVGGLAVALGLTPRTALLNDANQHLISFYEWLQRGLTVTDAPILKNLPSAYRKNRRRFNELVASGEWESAEAALLFYYLNRTCFNGLCRFNSSGFFNVPFGRYKSIQYRKDFAEYPLVFKDWTFTSGDFQDIGLLRDDFIYADPPYDVEFTSYAAQRFDWSDQIRLANWLASHGGPVVASNQATRRVLRLYNGLGFKVRTILAPRRISCNGNRDDALEMIATKNI